MQKVFMHKNELLVLGGLTLPNGAWPRGHHVDHPQYGTLTFVGKNSGVWFEFVKGKKTEQQLDLMYVNEKVEKETREYLKGLRELPPGTADARLVAIAITNIETGLTVLRHALA